MSRRQPNTAGGSDNAAEWLSQRELAARLGLTTRQVSNLTAEGMESRAVGNRREYPWPKALHWYIEFKLRTLAPSSMAEAQARKLAAEALITEIELAEKRRQVVPMEVCEAVGGEMADALRAILINAPSTYALDLERAGVPSETAEAVLEKLATDLTTALRGAVERVTLPNADEDA